MTLCVCVCARTPARDSLTSFPVFPGATLPSGGCRWELSASASLAAVYNFSILNLFLTEMSVCLKGVVVTSEMKIIKQSSKLGKDLMGPC